MNERITIVERIRAEIDALEAELKSLRLKANLGKLEARSRYEELEKTMREKTRPIRTKLKELSGETGDALKDVATGCERSWGEAKAAIRSAISRYRE